MFASILILILILPVTFIPLAIADLKANDELSEMGICLENHEEPAAYFIVDGCNLMKDRLMDQTETLPFAGSFC